MTLLMIMIALATPPTTESPFACNVNALTSAERHRHFDELGPALRSLRTANVFDARPVYGYNMPVSASRSLFLCHTQEMRHVRKSFRPIAIGLSKAGRQG